MARYISRPRAWIEDDLGPRDAGMLPQISVEDTAAVDTGLMDADGNAIWRTPNPIGFGRDGEW